MPFVTADDGAADLLQGLGGRRLAGRAQPRLAAELRRLGGRRPVPRRARPPRDRPRPPRPRPLQPDLARQRDGHLRRRPGLPDRRPRPDRPDPGRPLHRRRRDRPLRRPARQRPGRPAGAGLRRAAAHAADRRQPRGPARSRCSTRSAPARRANRSQLYRDLADGPFFGHNRKQDVDQGFRDAFWLQSMACGHRAPTSASRRSRPPTSAPTWPRSTSRRWSSTATTTRSCRSRSAASAPPSWSPAPCSRSTRAAATPCPTPTATGCTPTCSQFIDS